MSVSSKLMPMDLLLTERPAQFKPHTGELEKAVLKYKTAYEAHMKHLATEKDPNLDETIDFLSQAAKTLNDSPKNPAPTKTFIIDGYDYFRADIKRVISIARSILESYDRHSKTTYPDTFNGLDRIEKTFKEKIQLAPAQRAVTQEAFETIEKMYQADVTLKVYDLASILQISDLIHRAENTISSIMENAKTTKNERFAQHDPNQVNSEKPTQDQLKIRSDLYLLLSSVSKLNVETSLVYSSLNESLTIPKELELVFKNHPELFEQARKDLKKHFAEKHFTLFANLTEHYLKLIPRQIELIAKISNDESIPKFLEDIKNYSDSVFKQLEEIEQTLKSQSILTEENNAQTLEEILPKSERLKSNEFTEIDKSLHEILLRLGESEKFRQDVLYVDFTKKGTGPITIKEKQITDSNVKSIEEAKKHVDEDLQQLLKLRKIQVEDTSDAFSTVKKAMEKFNPLFEKLANLGQPVIEEEVSEAESSSSSVAVNPKDQLNETNVPPSSWRGIFSFLGSSSK